MLTTNYKKKDKIKCIPKYRKERNTYNIQTLRTNKNQFTDKLTKLKKKSTTFNNIGHVLEMLYLYLKYFSF